MKTGTYNLGDYRSQCIGIDTNSPVRLSSNEQDEVTALLQQYCTTFVTFIRHIVSHVCTAVMMIVSRFIQLVI